MSLLDSITVSVTITKQSLMDIMTTAFEQGIGYWAFDEDFANAEATRNGDAYVTSLILTRARGSKTPAFSPLVEATRNRAIITVPDLAAAFGRALSTKDDGTPVNEVAFFAATAQLSGNYDAGTADVLVQFAAFGDVIYG